MGLLQALGLKGKPKADEASDAPASPAATKPPRMSKQAQRQMFDDATAYAGALAKAQAALDQLADPTLEGGRQRLQTEAIDAARSIAKGRDFVEATRLLEPVPQLASALLHGQGAASAGAQPAASAADTVPPVAPPPVPAAGAEQAAFEQAKAKTQADVDAALKVIADLQPDLPDAAIQAFDSAQAAVDSAAAARQWAAAQAGLPALGVAARALVDAGAAHAKFLAAYAPLEPDHKAAADELRGASAPAAVQSAFLQAQAALTTARDAKDWVAALAAVAPLRKASDALRANFKAGAEYYVAFDAIRKDYDDAQKLLDDKVIAEAGLRPTIMAFVRTRAVMRAAVAARQWHKAHTSLAAVHAAALALTAAVTTFQAQLAAFDVEFAKLSNLTGAKKIAADPPARLKDTQARDFRTAFQVVNDGRNGADFATATAGLPALQTAIDALLKAYEQYASERLAFELSMYSMPEYGAAVVLAAHPPASMAAQAADFQAADQVLAGHKFAEDWGAAKAAVPVLQKACAALMKAKAALNAAAGPQEIDALRKRVDALKPRTDKAAEPAGSTFIGALQQGVVQRLQQIEKSLAARDVADAEVDLGALPADLDALERAVLEHAAHRAKYQAAKDGEVKKALEMALQPDDLAKTRDAALGKTEQSILDFADQALIAQADAAVLQWLKEAGAWTASKAAYDSLASGKPDDKKLAALTAKPGGGEVLDALVAALPGEPSQRVMGAALKARFGFKVKRFEKPNADEADLTGLTPISPKKPDKSLKQVYAVLGKVPVKNIKGKITELIDYDADAGGAMYDAKKIYMYCGRPGDPKVKDQAFNEPGIVPPGEDVQPECKPVDDAPLPMFDFALLHEAGHAEDDAKKFMESHFDDAAFGNWHEYKSSDAVAEIAAKHFQFDAAYVKATLKAKGSTPPAYAPAAPKGTDEADWEKARLAAVAWCQAVRVDNQLWGSASLAKQNTLDGFVYQEAYAGTWVRYAYAARAQGITTYQFRSHWEWYAELYAAYFSNKLKDSHPAMSWLKDLKPPVPH